MSLLIQDCALLDATAPAGVRDHCTLLIEGSRIARIESAPLVVPAGARVIDGRDLLAMPGLVNAHTHSPENLLRASTEAMPLEPWLVALYGISGTFSERDIYLNVMLGAIEMLRSGVTSVIDHLWCPGPMTAGYLDTAMRAYAESGMRAAVAPIFGDHPYEQTLAEQMGISLLDTAYIQRSFPVSPLSEMMDMFEAWIKRWHGLYDGRLRCFVGPGGAQWCSADLLHAAADLARRYETGLHMHLLETHVQDIGARQHFEMSALQWLAKEGILQPNMSLPHSVWIYDDADLHALAASGACVVHNPAANLKLGSGLAPIRRMRDLGIPVALGCDGAVSSDNQVIFETMRLAALIHTLTDADPARWLQAHEVVEMATIGGAAALVLPGQVGALHPGYLADITLLDRRSPHLLPLNNLHRHLTFCETGSSVHTVIVNGEVAVEAGRIVAFDADSILNEIYETMHQRQWQQPVMPEIQQAMELFSRWRQAVLDTYGTYPGNGT